MRPMTMPSAKGKVFIVGAGPGDPKLLTLRAREVLLEADVVMHDRLVSKEVLRLVPPRAKKLYSGKRPGDNGASQDLINRRMVSEARRGRTVVRLKGGDPFLFSRGGEEAEMLRAERIDFEIVPGVTSALAAPAYAGIPLTHRQYSSSVAIVTGHAAESKEGSRESLPFLCRNAETIVMLMSVARLRAIASDLIGAGLPGETLVAAVEWGTTEAQKTLLFTLSEAAKGYHSGRISPPSVVVVGRIAALAHRLRWYRKSAVQCSSGYKAAMTQGSSFRNSATRG